MIDDLKEREKENRPELQAENTGYEKVEKAGIRVYKSEQ